IALDITPEMLDVARPAATLSGASLVFADARALPFPGRLRRRDLRRRPGQSPAGHRSRPAGTGPGDQARRPARALPSLRPRRARREARPRALARRTPGGGPAVPVDGGRRLGGDGLRRRAAPLLRGRRTPLAAQSGPRSQHARLGLPALRATVLGLGPTGPIEVALWAPGLRRFCPCGPQG